MKKLGFDKKIIIVVSVMTALVLLASSLAGFVLSQRMLSSESGAKIMNELEHQAAVLDGWIERQQAVVSDISNFNVTLKPEMLQIRDVLLSAIEDSNGTLFEAYVSFPNNTTRFAHEVELPPEFDVRERSWYKDAVNARGKPICTAPYIDYNTGAMVITVADAGFDKDGSLYALAGGDVYIDQLISTCEAIKISENAYPFLLDGDGNILVHENKDYLPAIVGSEGVYTNIRDIDAYKGGFKTGELLTQADYDGKMHVIGTVSLFNGWVLGYSVEQATYNQALTSLAVVQMVIMVVSMILVIVLCTFVIRSCLKPVDKLREAAESMAAGNFNVALDYDANDALGLLSESMKKLCDNTRNIIEDLGMILAGMERGDLTTMSRDAGIYIGEYFNLIGSVRSFRSKISTTLSTINSSAEQVSSGSEQVSSGAQALSQGATEQASSIEELAATIHEVMNRININAEAAKNAMDKTNEAGGEMARATEKMNELLSAMAETKECSDQIGKIIKSIEDIAFQTNILALNAAVEAARAGEAGKGFAVVADEVRNLAGKSAEAAANTNTLIENTIRSVDNGNALVNQVAEVMSKVADAAAQVAELNTNIHTSTDELVDSVAQINKGVEQISGVVQTNSATAQQSAATSEELSGQAATLEQLVSEFKLS